MPLELTYPHIAKEFGQLIRDLELIAEATDSDYWRNRIEQLPL